MIENPSRCYTFFFFLSLVCLVLKRCFLLLILFPHILPASTAAALCPPAPPPSLRGRISARLLSERGGVEVDAQPIHKDVSHREGMENAIRLFLSPPTMVDLQSCSSAGSWLELHTTHALTHTHTWRCSTHLPDTLESRNVMHTLTQVATLESI